MQSARSKCIQIQIYRQIDSLLLNSTATKINGKTVFLPNPKRIFDAQRLSILKSSGIVEH